MSTEENQFNVQGYNIVTILKRLESATSRLEDITIYQEEANRLRNEQSGDQTKSAKQNSIGSTSSDITNATKLIEGDNNKSNHAAKIDKSIDKGESKEDKEKAAGNGKKEKTNVPDSVGDFNAIIKHKVVPFVKTSEDIDKIVGKSAKLLHKAFVNQKKFLDIAHKSKKPNFSDPNLPKVLEPINSNISKIVEIKDENRKSPFFNHLNTIGEGSPVLGWILTETPVSMIPEYKDSAKFWSDRILKEFKGKDIIHLQWVKEFLDIFDSLKDYVKKYHATGPWNPQGKELGDVIKEEGLIEDGPDTELIEDEPSSVSGGPAPPPPPPPPPPADLYSEPAAPAGGINAVFADLNKGEGITSGLRKVDKSEMTHKNPDLRQTKKPVPPKKPVSLSTNSSTGNVPAKKPARQELIDGTKWLIENFTKQDLTEPIIIEAEMSQSVFIGNCQDITIQIKGKANAISISDTRNVGVVIDSLVSGLDVIRSFKFGVQVLDVVPMINIDKSDEGNLYISQQSIDTDIQIFSSCSTALNVNVPAADDFKELYIPEQFIHKIKNGKLTSEVVEHAG